LKIGYYCPVDCYYCLNFPSAGKGMQNGYFKNGNLRILMHTKFTADHMSGYSWTLLIWNI